jgi:spermidine/putrescine transport system ATP-binding protein
MRHGRIDQIGAPEDVYESPATEFVAGFLGASNMLDGRIAGSDDGLTTISLDAGGTVRAPSDRVPPGAGTQVRVGVRPEKLTIAPDDGAASADRNHVAGLVRMSTYIGVNYQYEVDGPGGTNLRIYVQNLGAAGTHPNAGDKVRLEWLPEHTFVVEPTLSEEDKQEEAVG